MVESSLETYKFLLRNQNSHQKYLTRVTDIALNGSPVQHATSPLGRPALLVPLEGSEFAVEDRNQRGFTIDTFSLTADEGQSLRYVRLESRESIFDREFSAMVDDILNVMSGSPDDSMTVFFESLTRWKSMFGRQMPEILPIEMQIGLIGELSLLLELINLVGPKAIENWTGPDRARHDFNSDLSAVEVKATLRRDYFLVTIHGLTQLEPPPGRTLKILAFQFEKSPNGVSLPEVVSRIEDKLVSCDLFSKKISSLGYDSRLASQYEKYRFSLLGVRLHEVDADFPRLIVSTDQEVSVIHEIQYGLDLGALRPLAIDSVALQTAASLLRISNAS
jgi:hypothetical protein